MNCDSVTWPFWGERGAGGGDFFLVKFFFFFFFKYFFGCFCWIFVGFKLRKRKHAFVFVGFLLDLS